MSRPAQMKSAAVGLDIEDDLSEDDELSSLILLCRSRKNEKRGEGGSDGDDGVTDERGGGERRWCV